VAALHEWLYVEARAKLARAAEALEPLAVRTTSEVRVGLPMTEIVLAANKARADLIVMAPHGSGASAAPSSKRVAEYVIRHARCPVLVSAPPPSRPVHAGAAESRSGRGAAARS
jgi:nucleotide-binding universal stress UspA family protein